MSAYTDGEEIVYWYSHWKLEKTDLANLKNAVTTYVLQAPCHYVGITDNPKRRYDEEHRKNGWITMVVVHKTTRVGVAQRLEKRLIRHLRESPYASRCLNQTMGGETPRQSSDRGSYYVYILLGPGSVRNRVWGEPEPIYMGGSF